MDSISVTKFNSIVRDIFNSEELLHNISIVGEVFGVSRAKSAIYFSLKDEESTLPCITFNQDLFDEIKEGDLVIIQGSPNFYVKSGRFNFITYKIAPAGLGVLYQRFVELKNKLEKEGLFAEEHKKPMPKSIKRIGVVTSKDGAVIQDIKNVAWRRNPSVDIVLYPCKVQGNGAEKEIVEGIDFFSNYDKVDAVIVARGGGSMEDLSAYNTEIVARSAYNCNKFLVSAVGHEVDFTIIDFVSDLRAPTPSAAAELLTEDRQKERLNFGHIYSKLTRQLNAYIADNLDLYNNLTSSFLTRAEDLLEDKKARLLTGVNKLSYLSEKLITRAQHELELKLSALPSLNPYNVLKRGYAKVEQNGKPIKRVLDVDEKTPVAIYLQDGELIASVQEKNLKEQKNV